MVDAATLLKTKTTIPWEDRIKVLLKAYGQQLPAKSKLCNPDQISHEDELEAEIRALDVAFTKTQFMYMCQVTAIFQQPEMKGIPVKSLVDIKTFKKRF